MARRLLLNAACGFLFALSTSTLQPGIATAQHAPERLDAHKVDTVLGRSGVWKNGAYVVTFLRPDLHVMFEGVQLAPGHVHSSASFVGADDDAEIMGDICAQMRQVTAVVEALRKNGMDVTGVHDHFLGESPLLTFVHYHGHGTALSLAQAFRSALIAASTPLDDPPSTGTKTEPIWIASVQNALGRRLSYSAAEERLSAEVPRADFPSSAMDSMYASSLNFQDADKGQVLAICDFALTANEVNQVVSTLVDHGFKIATLHNHMLDEQPRLFFLHFWKTGSPEEVGAGIKAALAGIQARQGGTKMRPLRRRFPFWFVCPRQIKSTKNMALDFSAVSTAISFDSQGELEHAEVEFLTT